MRAVRIARSVGRPSRLKKPPGIFPAAYMRSSTSIVSGKKSAPSRPSVRPWAVARTMVSPERMTTAPSACFDSLPVSNVLSLPPISTDTETGAACCSPSMMLIAVFLHCACVEGGNLNQLLRGSSVKLPPSGALELAAQAEFLDEGAVALEILLLQVVQKPAAPADELEQAATRVVILRVRPQVLGEAVDALGQHRDLNLGRARVLRVLAEPFRRFLLRFLGEGHPSSCVDVAFVPANAAQGRRERPSRGRRVG